LFRSDVFTEGSEDMARKTTDQTDITDTTSRIWNILQTAIPRLALQIAEFK
jgi:hypothetical protein